MSLTKQFGTSADFGNIGVFNVAALPNGRTIATACYGGAEISSDPALDHGNPESTNTYDMV